MTMTNNPGVDAGDGTLSVPQAASELGLTTLQVYQLVDAGDLDYIRGDGSQGRGTLVRIPRAALEQYRSHQ